MRSREQQGGVDMGRNDNQMTSRMTSRLCCCIPDQSKLDEGCKNLAEYVIYNESNNPYEGYTESCGEHLEQMLDDSHRFTVDRIETGTA